MQKIINGIALLSGLVSFSIVGTGVYFYKNADVLIENAREKATEEVKKAVMDAVPGIVGGLMPSVPDVTGGAIPAPPNVGGGAPAVTSPAIPIF
jgi:hypothetical protein